MLERTEKISFRISSLLSKVEPEPAPGAGPSNRLQEKSNGSAVTSVVDRIRNYLFRIRIQL